MRGRPLAGLVGVGLIAVALVATVVLAGGDEPTVTMDPGDDAAMPGPVDSGAASPALARDDATPPAPTEEHRPPPLPTDDDATPLSPTEHDLAEVQLAEGAAVVWPFDGVEVAVISSGDTGRGELRAVADEVAGHERVADIEVLDAATVRRRLGPVQAQRLSPGGAVVATLGPELGEHQALVVAGRLSRSLTQRGLDEHVAALARPSCRALADSAALTGRSKAAEVLRATGCAESVRMAAAAPDADEPWVVSSGFSSTSGQGQQCVRITTVRVRSTAGCATQPSAMGDQPHDAIVGVVGTPWDGGPAVLAGIAPQGTETVRLDGTPVTVAEGPPGLVDDAEAGLPVFAGEVAVEGDAATATALRGDGAVLAERAVRPADFPGVSSVAPWRLEAAWPFQRVDRAVVVVSSDAAPGQVADRLAAIDGVRQVTRAGTQEAAAARAVMSEATSPFRGDVPRPLLVVSAADRQRALMLGRQPEQRHGLVHVATPTCGALAGSAIFRGVDHARELLQAAACERPTPVAAAPEAEPPWVMAAAVTDEGLCRVLQSGHSISVGCHSPPGDGRMQLESSVVSRSGPPDPQFVARQVVGVVSGDVATVEIRVADDVVADLDPVAVTESTSAFAARVGLDARSVHARALNAAGEVVAEDEAVAEGG